MKIKQQAEQSIARFRERVLPVHWTPRGILTSEGFAVCMMADLHGIDALIETGVASARSTEMWAKYLPAPGAVIAIDWKITDDARARLAPYNNVLLCEGDAMRLLPSTVKQMRKRRVGVFIDGPKGAAAVDLARQCMAYPHVAFVGVHDMSKLMHGCPHAERALFEAVGGLQWLTDDQWFVDAYQSLDADDSHWDEEQGTRWTPGYRNEWGKPPVSLGSYGYTTGFLHKEAKHDG
jgi:hypothetical protein